MDGEVPLERAVYWLPHLVAGASTALVALYILKRRVIPGAAALVVLMLAMTEWAVGSGLQLMSTSLPAKIFWAKAQYLGIIITPCASLFFVCQYSGVRAWLRWPYVLLVSVLPLASFALVLSYPANQLMWSSVTLDRSGPFPMAVFGYGSWFWFWTAYADLLLFVSVALLVRTYIGSSRLYRRQVSVLLIGLSAPWIGNTVYLAGLSPVPNMDPTPVFFLITGLALAWGLYRFRLQDIVPVAREVVFEGMKDGAVVLDAFDRIVDVNPMAQMIVGRSQADLIGHPVQEVFSEHSGLVDGFSASGEVHKELAMGGGETVRHYDIMLSPLFDSRKHFLGRLLVLRDISERKHAEEELRRLATTDSLTELFNRRHFLELAQREVVRANRYKRPLSLMMMDIDHFKKVNDSYGHDAGDRVLVHLARIGLEQIRDVDIFGRIGGEEFAILLPDTDLASGGEAAERLRREVAGTVVEVNGQQVRITISIGVSTLTESIQDLDALMISADRALYSAKWKGRNKVCYADVRAEARS